MVTFGFYDSVDHDRRYNAIQFGSMFDGVIKDGIFMSIGTCFRVIPGDNMTVLVGAGRAWFDHTWTLNDSPLSIEIPQSELVLNRIDAVVLDVNAARNSRANSIMVIKGTPRETPQRPKLINDADHHQYPLAFISVKAGVTSIRAADITSMIGTSSTPYVTGILETVSIDALLDQWEDQWLRWFETETVTNEQEWETWKTNAQKEFLQWFETLEYILSDDAAGKLTVEVLQLREDVDSLNKIKETKMVNLPASGWTGGTAPYEQTVNVDGVTADMEAILLNALAENANEATQKAYVKAFNIISSGTATLGNGTATFRVYKRPTTDCTVGLKGV